MSTVDRRGGMPEAGLGASEAGPQARPDQQSDSSAAPQGVQAEPPPGFVLVPKEPTEAMHAAAVRTIVRCNGNDDFPPRVWRAMLAAAPAAPAQEPQQPDVPTKQAAVLMKLIRAAWKGDPEIAEAYGNLLAERMDADGRPGRYVRDTLAILRGERQEVLIHPAAASSPAPAVQPTEAVAELVEALRDVMVMWDSPQPRKLDDALTWRQNDERARTKARALIAKHGQPQGGSNAE